MPAKTHTSKAFAVPDHITPQVLLCRDQGIYLRARRGQIKENKQPATLQRLEQSFQERLKRQQQLPRPEFKNDLPIHQCLDEIRTCLNEHQVSIICGDTGSGKTTQLPKICLSMGIGCRGFIGHTQPRRIAARSVATRIAQELNTSLGVWVGYKTRFEDHQSRDGYIKLMTDGILLAEIQHDPYLKHYELIIIDEAHERSLNIDFILGHLKTILNKRTDLKIIITSATINPQSFSSFFNDAPIIQIPGKTYPIDHYFEPDDPSADEGDSLVTRICLLVEDILTSEQAGDVLVFLPGEQLIREISRKLHNRLSQRAHLLPLYSRLSPEQQKQIFRESAMPKVVLATNVAETSLTVPGIRYVIDSGLARISRYSVRSKIQRLPIEKVSRASIHQRAGRCGRTAPGACFHLYGQEDYERRPEFTEPEILRTHLAGVILLMTASRLGRIEEFPFIDPPEQKYINDGYRLLRDLHALDDNDQLTATGVAMSRLPLDPRFARIIVESRHQGCLRETITVVAALAAGDPRLYPVERLEQAQYLHQRFYDKHSDFMGYLSLWEHLQLNKTELSNSGFRRLCEQEFLHYSRWLEWRELRNRLIHNAHEMGWKLNTNVPSYEQIHICLLTGFIDHIGRYDAEKKQYTGLRQHNFSPHRHSFLQKQCPTWIMASALTETSRVFATICAKIEPQWIESTARHLLKHEYSDPYWDASSGYVHAIEKTSLHGLILSTGKRVSYERIDPQEARNLFIRQALVHLELETTAPFMQHNRRLLERLAQYGNKLRRPGLEPDNEAIVTQLDEVVPEDVNSTKSFSKWYAQEKPDKALCFSDATVFHAIEPHLIDQQYPDRLLLDQQTLQIEYCFCPDDERDGITYLIDLPALSHMQEDLAEWLIAPWSMEKLQLIFRGLPKASRQKLNPIEHFVQLFINRHPPYSGGFYQRLSKFLYAYDIRDQSVRSLREISLPDYLRPHYAVLNHGEKLAQSSNLAQLQAQFKRQSELALKTHALVQEDSARYKKWPTQVLEEEMEITSHHHSVKVYPALADCGDYVSLLYLNEKAEAIKTHTDGVMRLIEFTLHDIIRYVKKQLINKSPLALLYRMVDPQSAISDEIIYHVTFELFIADNTLPRTEADFNLLVNNNKSGFVPLAEKTLKHLLGALKHYQTLKNILNSNRPYLTSDSLKDIDSQLEQLFYSGFLYDISQSNLAEYEYYLTSLQRRIEKAANHPREEFRRCESIQDLWQAYCDLDAWFTEHALRPPELSACHWLLQDYRVHLFTQDMQKRKITRKSIEQQFEKVRKSKLHYDS